MCDEMIRAQIVRQLCCKERVVSPAASIHEMKRLFGLTCSNTVFKRALGSAVSRGMVVRHRPHALSVGDDSERPITLRSTPRGKELLRQQALLDGTTDAYFVR